MPQIFFKKFGLSLLFLSFLTSLFATSELKTSVCIKKSHQGSSKPTIFPETDSFTELVEKSSVFIDTSLFIKEFLTSLAHVTRIVHPRKWGKTINAKMLAHFLRMEVDANGNMIPPNETAAYKLFALGRTKSSDEVKLNIARHQDIINGSLARFPVIYVSYKNVKGSNFEEIFHGVKKATADAYRQHEYLMNVYQQEISNGSDDWLIREPKERLEKFKKILALTTESEFDVAMSLSNLAAYLKEHFKKSVFIILEDHDKPLHSVFTQNLNLKDFERVEDLLVQVLGMTFKGNPGLWAALITGVFMVTQVSGFSSFMNTCEYNILEDSKYLDYYGFTEKQVNSLFEHFAIDATLADEARSWYRGFTRKSSQFETTVMIEKVVYNPWDIANFLRSKKILNYWEESESNHFLQDFLKFRKVEASMLGLLNGGEFDHENWGCHVIRQSVYELKEILEGVEGASKSSVAGKFGSFLFVTGYLTFCENDRDYGCLPNAEIASKMVERLIKHYRDSYHVPSNVQGQVTEQLGRLAAMQDVGNLKKSFEGLFKHFFLVENDEKKDKLNVKSAFNLVILMARQIHKNAEVYLFEPIFQGYEKKLADVRANMTFMANDSKKIVVKFEYESKKSSVHNKNYTKMYGNGGGVKATRLISVKVGLNKTVGIKDCWVKNE